MAPYIEVDVEAGDNSPWAVVKMFQANDEPREVSQVTTLRPDGSTGPCAVTGWDGGGPTPAYAATVADSGEGWGAAGVRRRRGHPTQARRVALALGPQGCRAVGRALPVAPPQCPRRLATLRRQAERTQVTKQRIVRSFICRRVQRLHSTTQNEAVIRWEWKRRTGNCLTSWSEYALGCWHRRGSSATKVGPVLKE